MACFAQPALQSPNISLLSNKIKKAANSHNLEATTGENLAFLQETLLQQLISYQIAVDYFSCSIHVLGYVQTAGKADFLKSDL